MTGDRWWVTVAGWAWSSLSGCAVPVGAIEQDDVATGVRCG